MEKANLTPEANQKIADFFRTERTEDEKLAMAFDIIKRMPPEDALRLILYLCSGTPELTETELFIKFAKYFIDINGPDLPFPPTQEK